MGESEASGVLQITPEDRVRESDLQFRTSRSGGPGGQNVNKGWRRAWSCSSTPRAWGRFLTSKRARLAELRPGWASDGVLHLVSQRHRSQRRNREEGDRALRLAAAMGVAATSGRKRTACRALPARHAWRRSGTARGSSSSVVQCAISTEPAAGSSLSSGSWTRGVLRAARSVTQVMRVEEERAPAYGTSGPSAPDAAFRPRWGHSWRGTLAGHKPAGRRRVPSNRLPGRPWERSLPQSITPAEPVIAQEQVARVEVAVHQAGRPRPSRQPLHQRQVGERR